jgi:hypothetical protein
MDVHTCYVFVSICDRKKKNGDLMKMCPSLLAAREVDGLEAVLLASLRSQPTLSPLPVAQITVRRLIIFFLVTYLVWPLPQRGQVADGHGGCQTGTGSRRFAGVTRRGIKARPVPHLAVLVPPHLHLGGLLWRSQTPSRSAVEIVGAHAGAGPGASISGAIRLRKRALTDGGVAGGRGRPQGV